jgi:hypothetical protein
MTLTRHRIDPSQRSQEEKEQTATITPDGNDTHHCSPIPTPDPIIAPLHIPLHRRVETLAVLFLFFFPFLFFSLGLYCLFLSLSFIFYLYLVYLTHSLFFTLLLHSLEGRVGPRGGRRKEEREWRRKKLKVEVKVKPG